MRAFHLSCHRVRRQGHRMEQSIDVLVKAFRLADMTKSGDLDLQETGLQSHYNSSQPCRSRCQPFTAFLALLVRRRTSNPCDPRFASLLWQEFVTWYATFSFSEETWCNSLFARKARFEASHAGRAFQQI